MLWWLHQQAQSAIADGYCSKEIPSRHHPACEIAPPVEGAVADVCTGLHWSPLCTGMCCLQAQQALMEVSWPEGLMGGDDKSNLGAKSASRRRLKCGSLSLCYVQLRDQFLGAVIHKCDIVCMQGCFARKWSEICRHPGPPCNKHVTFLVVTLLHFHAVQVACLLTCLSGRNISEHTLGCLVTHAASQLLSDMLVTMSYTVCSHRSE